MSRHTDEDFEALQLIVLAMAAYTMEKSKNPGDFIDNVRPVVHSLALERYTGPVEAVRDAADTWFTELYAIQARLLAARD